MNCLRYLALVWLMAGGGWLTAQVYTVQSTPDPKVGGNGYVSDPAGLLAGEDVARLNSLIAELEQTSTAQVAVVILPSIGDEVPKMFATSLFEHWGIGQKGVDNGVLLLVVMDQRRSEIETGYGIEAIVPDVICYRILLEELVPRFQQQDYAGGLIATVARIKALLESPEALAEMRASLDPQQGWPVVMGRRVHPALYWYGLASLLFGVGILAWLFLTLLNKEELYDKYRNIRFTTALLFVFLFPLPYLLIYFIQKGVLNRLRNQPRFSKINGLPMHKLSEEEDDAFLKEGQVSEEVVGSVDYDVWITDDHSDILILPYTKRFSSYSACPQCSFRTYHHLHTRVLNHATYHSSGQQEVIYECKNCNYRNRTIQVIPMKTRSSSGGGGGGGGGSWGGGSSGGGGAGASW